MLSLNVRDSNAFKREESAEHVHQVGFVSLISIAST
jgi:hypothetical protein